MNMLRIKKSRGNRKPKAELLPLEKGIPYGCIDNSIPKSS